MAFYWISLKIQSLSQPHAVSVARFGRLDQTVESPLGSKTAFPPTPQTWKKLPIVYIFTLFSISKCTKLGFPDEFLNLQFLAERNIACAVLMMAEQPWFSVGGGKWPTLGSWETRHTSPLKSLVSEGQGQVSPSGALRTLAAGDWRVWRVGCSLWKRPVVSLAACSRLCPADDGISKSVQQSMKWDQ